MHVRASEKLGTRKSGTRKGKNSQHPGRSASKGSTLHTLQGPQTCAEYELVA